MAKIDFGFFENIVAYKFLTDSIYLATVADYVQPYFFDNESIGRIFEVVKDFYTRNTKIPTATEIKMYLQTDSDRKSLVDVLESVKDIDKNLDTTELYNNTENFIKKKALYHAILDTAKKLDTIDAADVIHRFDNICNINLTTDFGLDLFRHIDKVVDDIANKDKTISTGWRFLDKYLSGGFLEQGRSIYVFAGETNIGKSIVLGNVAANLARQGKNVLLITLEMSELVYAKRLCSNITSIPANMLEKDPEGLRQAMKTSECGKIIIKEFPPSTITPNHLQGFIKRLVSSGIRIDAIVLDYINLLTSTVGNGLYEKIKYIVEQTRALTYIFACPLITATQLNRSGVGTMNPKTDTVSESFGLPATADVMISIFQSDEDRELGIIRFGLMKNRYGQRDISSPMKIDYPTLTITDSDIEEFMESGEVDDALESLSLFGDG